MNDGTATATGGGETGASVGAPAPADSGASQAGASSSPQADTRPGSWAEAFGSAPAGETAALPAPLDATTPDPPLAATPPPGESEAVPVPDAIDATSQGPIPFVRHQAALENARTKAIESVVSQVKEQYGAGLEFQTRFDADPVGTIEGVISGLASDPQHGPALMSTIARMLSGAKRQAQASAEPQPDLQAADGTLLYSADQQARRDAWFKDQMLREMRQEVAPLHARETERQQQVAHAQAVQAAQTRMGQLYQSFAARPHFTEHKPAIVEKFKALRESHPHLDLGSALGLAYADVIESQVVPRQIASQQQQAQAQAVAKATGRSTPPGQTVPSPQGRPTGWGEAFAAAGMR